MKNKKLGKVHEVRTSLLNSLKRTKFYIAGGSLSYNKYIKDVDVYFYTEKDYLQAKNKYMPNQNCISETENALTFTLKSAKPSLFGENFITVQFIKKYFGSPEEILSQFDINKSKIYMTSSGDIKTLEDYNNPLDFNPKYASVDIVSRLNKYINKKGFPNSPELCKKLVNFLYKNSYNELPPSYNTKKPRKGIDLMLDHQLEFILADYPELLESHKNIIKNNYPELLI